MAKVKPTPQNVLVVESDKGIQGLLKAYLTNLSCKKIVVCDDYRNALVECSGENGFDLLIFDWKAKDISPPDFIERFQHQNANGAVPIIALSGFLTGKDVAYVKDYPHLSFLVKPFSEEVFLTTIEKNYAKSSLNQIGKSDLFIMKGSGKDSKGLEVHKQEKSSSFKTTEEKSAIANPGFIDIDHDALANLIDEAFSGSTLANPNDFGPSDDGEILRLYSNFANSGSLFFADSNQETEVQSRKIGLRTALLLENDEALSKILSKYLLEIGVVDIVPVFSGDQAWQQLNQRKFDIFILDWKSKDLTGLALYNRIRKDKKLTHQPIIVTAGNPGKINFKIIEEHRNTYFLEKPFQISAIDRVLIKLFSIVNQDQYVATETAKLIGKIQSENKQLITVLEEVLKTVKPASIALVFSAKYLIENQLYQDAERVLQVGLKLVPKHVGMMTMLGKALHKLNRHKEAYRILSQASSFSMENIERLCLLGEVGLSLRDPNRARDYFKKALIIDKEDEIAKAGIVLSDNLEKFIEDYSLQLISLETQFASMLNVVAITFVRNRKFEEGFAQYHAALAFVDDKYTTARLKFNLGLAHLRAYQFDPARDWLKLAKLDAEKGFEKPAEFLLKVDVYQKTYEKGSDKLLMDDNMFEWVDV